MRLLDAMNVQRGDVVAFVGAGGKTHTLFRLASELVDDGWRVLSTTTTRMAQDELRFAPQRVGFGHGMRPPDSLPDQIAQHRHVFVFTRLEENDKVRGVRPGWLDENLTGFEDYDVVLVEADGSRRLPMKAPLPHEPVIPASATVVVPVIGLDVIGVTLDDDHVYGAEQIATTLGVKLGTTVTPELSAAVLLHPNLGLKGIAPTARVIPILNKVTPALHSIARRMAYRLLSDYRIERVIIGATREPDPVLSCQRRVGAVVLAAGSSNRMGQPKLLLPWGRSSTIIRTVSESILRVEGLTDIVLVTGALTPEIRAEVGDLPLRLARNPDPDRGDMLASLQIGLRALWNTVDAALIVLGDQPLIRPETVQGVIQAYSEGKGGIVAPSYQNRRGHPILIDREFWPAIMELPPGSAPRDVIRANESSIYHLVVDKDSVLRDIDTPEDYQQAHNDRGNY